MYGVSAQNSRGECLASLNFAGRTVPSLLYQNLLTYGVGLRLGAFHAHTVQGLEQILLDLLDLGREGIQAIGDPDELVGQPTSHSHGVEVSGDVVGLQKVVLQVLEFGLELLYRTDDLCQYAPIRGNICLESAF